MTGLSSRDEPLLLRTERLLLRPLQPDDLSAIARWPPFTAPIDRLWDWSEQFDLSQASVSMLKEATRQSDAQAWAILIGDTVAGMLQITRVRAAQRDANLGLAFGAPWTGLGYGREALTAFLDMYFERLDFELVRLEVALANIRALTLYRRLAFEETGRFWQDTGSAAYEVLDDPAYAQLRPYFRLGQMGFYQL